MNNYNNVIMGAIASQITSLTIVYSIVYSNADQRKHQSSASLAFPRTNGQLRRKCFHLMTSSCKTTKTRDQSLHFKITTTSPHGQCLYVTTHTPTHDYICIPWWRHQMETFSALLAICAGNSPVPAQRWFKTLSCPLWRHYTDPAWLSLTNERKFVD